MWVTQNAQPKLACLRSSSAISPIPLFFIWSCFPVPRPKRKPQTNRAASRERLSSLWSEWVCVPCRSFTYTLSNRGRETFLHPSVCSHSAHWFCCHPGILALPISLLVRLAFRLAGHTYAGAKGSPAWRAPNWCKTVDKPRRRTPQHAAAATSNHVTLA